MSIYTRYALLVGSLLLALAAPRLVWAQRLPARTMVFEAQGADSATGQAVTIRLTGKSVGPKGRLYAGSCAVAAPRPGVEAHLVGEWLLTQNSGAALAGAARPAIGGSGVRPGAKPWRAGQNPTAPGQLVNFTIDPLPNGAYQVLLMDAFNDAALEFMWTDRRN